MRSLLNADVIGFHTFDYARHFLSCCSRMLGLEHHTNRGSIVVEYYGRKVSIKILPVGVKPDRCGRAAPVPAVQQSLRGPRQLSVHSTRASTSWSPLGIPQPDPVPLPVRHRLEPMLPDASSKSLCAGAFWRRYLEGFDWPEFQWRRGELLGEFGDRAVLVGVDDTDVFKGIELKIQVGSSGCEGAAGRPNGGRGAAMMLPARQERALHFGECGG